MRSPGPWWTLDPRTCVLMRGRGGYPGGGGRARAMWAQAQERLETPGLGRPGSCSPEGQRELGPAQPGFRTSGSSLRENGFLPAVCGTSWSASFPPDSLRKWGAGRACFLYKGARAPSTGVTLEVLDSVLRDTLPATPLALPWGQGLTPPAPCAARSRLSPRARPPVCHELHVEGARRIPPAVQRRRPRLGGGAGAARS